MEQADLEQFIAGLRSQAELLKQIEDLLVKYSTGEFEAPLSRRRGRRTMGAEERKAVALRMKNYWENRRKSKEG